ncbi:hypothetical protein [uncultured Sphingomonas sp.]|uniref:hypothetical protein n=1 Tax=uncultured Sphingomonas sp. TaxID=158754 RepID=UPI0025F7506D|nr:hypothetical protein [uncultured Sphingomonas sp.]
MTTFTPDQWIILGLVFALGLLVGMWLTSGGRRKWKTRYNEEVERRRTLERESKDREAHWTSREKEWREQDSLRTAAAGRHRDGPRFVETRDDETSRVTDIHGRDGQRRDVDRDGVPDRDDRRPADDRRF